MRRLWPLLSSVVIALWLGSLVHTLLSVSAIFRAYPKAESDVAVKAAPVIFAATERFNLALAIVGILAVFLWRKVACNRPRKLIFFLLVGGLVMGIIQIAGISRKMESLRAAGQSGEALFKQLHGVSSVQYLIQTAFLLAAAALLPCASKDAPCAIEKPSV